MSDAAALVGLYRGRTVLVTGHTGFKGGWLATWLKLAGARVVGFGLPPAAHAPSFFAAARVADGMVSVEGDVRDREAVADVVRAHRPEIVFHLAAQPLVRRSYEAPVETFATNVLGTAHVLEAARVTGGVRALVNVTSDKCYENRETARGYREDDALGGRDPYSASKACAELVAAAYRGSFFSGEPGVALACARAGNTIGGGDWSADRLVADIARGIAAGAPIVIRNPHAIRPWQHVLEPLSGYLTLGQRLCEGGAAFAEAWNFGPAELEHVTVEELARRIVTRWDAGELAPTGADGRAAPHEAGTLVLDSGKARARLGWRPRLSLGEAIDLTVDWYAAHARAPASIPDLTVAQIRAYERRLGDT